MKFRLKDIALVISLWAKRKLGHDSRTYFAGAKFYQYMSQFLKMLKIPVELLEKNKTTVIRHIAEESKSFQPRPDGKNIVFFTVRGWATHLAFETLLASRLRAEGHKVTFLSCFDSLPFCMFGPVNFLPEDRRNCKSCVSRKGNLWDHNFDTNYLDKPNEIDDPIADLVSELTLPECRSFQYEQAPYGELVYRSVVWYLRRSTLTEDDINVYRSALISAHIVRRSFEKFLKKNEVNVMVMLNGDFSAERVASWVLKNHGIRFITHDYSFHKLLAFGVNKSIWDDLTFDTANREMDIRCITKAEKKKANKILYNWRKRGGYQGHLFWNKTGLTKKKPIREKLILDNRPLAVAYTNMTFESSVTCKDKVFEDQFHWLTSLVKFFTEHEALQLVVRIHPAEVRDSHWRQNESLYQFIINEFSPLPDNIKVVGPSDKISSYDLGEIADAVLVYSSTLGMELADRRKQVITAAYVHYSERGFTIDPSSKSEYFAAIEKFLNQRSELSTIQRQSLVDYVAWLFLKRLVPFEAISNNQNSRYQVNINKVEDLLLPKYKGIQKITRLITDGTIWW